MAKSLSQAESKTYSTRSGVILSGLLGWASQWSRKELLKKKSYLRFTKIKKDLLKKKNWVSPPPP